MALLGACQAPTEDGESVRAEDARVRQLLPGQDKTAAYVDLYNDGAAPITLIGARSTHARAIEIHESVTAGDKVRMRRVKSVVIPGKETVRLAPGGLHLMLFGVEAVPASARIELLWAHGEALSVQFRQVAVGAQ